MVNLLVLLPDTTHAYLLDPHDISSLTSLLDRSSGMPSTWTNSGDLYVGGHVAGK